MSTMSSRITLLLLICGFLPAVLAQFGGWDFSQMFGQQRQQEPPSGTSQWAAQADTVPCSHYLCPTTLVCVRKPTDCPCPDVQDIKCTIPDAEDKDSGTVVCVRGEKQCAEVERLMKMGSTKK
ncbi:Long chronological lifespan protein 2 [Pleurotus ostreatus]|nr:Long chronological lifespan protein 2 [Pleurotus ostreatus]